MTEELEIQSPEASAASSVDMGQQLAVAREKLGLSVADVARHLKLGIRQVNALESADYDQLPGPIFVRGFIRNYAKLLQIDAELLLATHQEIIPQTLAPLGVTPSKAVSFSDTHASGWGKYRFAAIGLALLVALLIGFYHFFPGVLARIQVQNQPTRHVVAHTLPRQSASMAAVAKKPQSTMSRMPPVSTAASSSSVPVLMPAVKTPSPMVSAVPLVASTNALTLRSPTKNNTLSSATSTVAHGAAGSGPDHIGLKFSAGSWVEVRDSSGAVIFSQLNAAGGHQDVYGQAPLQVVVGNANAVKLTYNGRPVALAPYTKIDVAHLTLK